MVDQAEAAVIPSREISLDEQRLRQGAALFRLFAVDVDTDPDNPVVKCYFKRGEGNTDIQKRARAIINKEGEAGDFIYTDQECTLPVEEEDLDGWYLAVVRKQRAGKSVGIDKEWLKIVMSNPNLSDADKLAEIAKFTG